MKWKFEEYKRVNRPFQTDNYNCRILLIYFMHCLGKRKEMTSNLDLASYRTKIAQLLLCESENMRKTCLYCFLDHRVTWVMYKYCRRFAHSQCIPGVKKTEKEWAQPSGEFVCNRSARMDVTNLKVSEVLGICDCKTHCPCVNVS